MPSDLLGPCLTGILHQKKPEKWSLGIHAALEFKDLEICTKPRDRMLQHATCRSSTSNVCTCLFSLPVPMSICLSLFVVMFPFKFQFMLRLKSASIHIYIYIYVYIHTYIYIYISVSPYLCLDIATYQTICLYHVMYITAAIFTSIFNQCSDSHIRET